MPKPRRRASVISSKVRPPISTSAFGRSSVRGRKRVPRPAARTMAFIEKLSAKDYQQEERIARFAVKRTSFAHLLELQMAHHHFHAVPDTKVFCQLFSKINRTVLTTGAAERNHE